MIKVKLSEQQAAAILTAAREGSTTLTADQAQHNKEACEAIWKELSRHIESDRKINAV